LHASAERALRAPDPFADGVDLARCFGEQRKDAIGLTQIARAQDDRVGRIRALD
jgi:hypothetical protein